MLKTSEDTVQPKMVQRILEHCGSAHYHVEWHFTPCLPPGKDRTHMTKADQLQQFDAACKSFVKVVHSLSPQQFLAPLGDWAPRDIVAHLIGWNRNILVGCRQIRSGVPPFYHFDGPNDYRLVNAELIARFNSTDRELLLKELEKTKAEISAFLEGVPERDWDRDFGPQHYRGGSATIGRSVESLTRDYVDHAAEIVSGRPGASVD